MSPCPGKAVVDSDALRASIVSTVDAYLHPTSTVPMGAESDPTAAPPVLRSQQSETIKGR